ncbi:hypothetical protein MKW92_023164 [Papaver armeniacum]|nr:hypothetical protein MKW92_023164 [Papaver armeniacum]
MKLRSNRVYELPRVQKEEELVARAVDAAKIVLKSVQRPASSYDVAAVGTGANVSLEQETEDDDRLSTTSTIEHIYSEEEKYYYSEEGKYYYLEDEEDSRENACEDDHYDEEEDPTKNVDNNLEVLEMEVDDQGTIFSDPSDIEEFSMEEINEAVTSDEEWESSSDIGEKPSKEDWIASWNKGDPQKHLTWINVYAYYRKKKKGKGYGGYGVIIRYADAKPVTATAKYSKVGISFFHQLLMGIKAGVKLSKGHNLSGRYVICNSTEVERVLKHAFNCRTDKCRTSYSHNLICKGCKDYLDSCVGCDMGLWPLIQDLKHEEGLDLVKYPRTSNEAAHYLAKTAKAKHDGKKLKGIACDDEDLGEIKPDKFPPKLKDILWKDSIGGMTCYRAASR